MIGKRLSSKLALMFLAGTLTMCAAIVVVTAYLAGGVANEQADMALQSATSGKRSNLDLALSQLEENAELFLTLPDAKDSLMKMMAGWKNLGENQTATLRKIFVEDNPHGEDERHLLVSADANNYYANNHKLIHSNLEAVIAKGLFSDIALMDPNGNISYSYRKDDVFARNVAAAEIADHPMQLALSSLKVKADAETLAPGELFTSGFKVDETGKASLVLAGPVFYLDRFFGAVALSVDMARFSALLNEKAGLGESEKTVLVDASGTGYLLDDAGTVQEALNRDVINAAGGVFTVNDETFRYSRLDSSVSGSPFAVVKAMPQAELSKARDQIVYGVIITGIVCMVPVVFLIWWLTGRMFAPLRTLSGTAQRIADGEIELKVEAVERKDEIGDMARCIEVFRENSAERERLAAERQVGHIARENRQKLVEGLISDFRQEVQSVLSVVDENIARMENLAAHLNERSHAAMNQGQGVVVDAEQASANVQAVASATEELNASIAEISRQVATTAEIVGQTTSGANASNEKIAGLAEAASKIGDVVSLISEIAEQTNLLALNATIEAARAGDAGRGFAVVASEVKSLAGQTARATEEISAQVAAIQASTSEAVEDIRRVSTSIGEVNEYTSNITNAVHQQGAATDEISRNVSEAAHGTQNVSATVADLNSIVVENSASVTQMRDATISVREKAEHLRRSVETFLQQVSAA